jgi:hypothetical protein
MLNENKRNHEITVNYQLLGTHLNQPTHKGVYRSHDDAFTSMTLVDVVYHGRSIQMYK